MRDTGERGRAAAGAAIFLLLACGRGDQGAEGRHSAPEVAVTAPQWHAVQVSRQEAEDTQLLRCVGGDTLRPGVPAWNAASEPHAAVDPRDGTSLVVTWQAHNGARSVILAAESFDGGQQWTPPRVLPLSACAGLTRVKLDAVSDPWTAIGADGRRYLAANAWNEATDSGAVVVLSSASVRAAPTEVTAIPLYDHTKFAWIDGTFMTASPVVPGTAFLLTTRFLVPDEQRAAVTAGRETNWRTFASPAVLMVTRDGGRTWSAPRPVTPVRAGLYAGAPQLLVHPQTGRLLVFYTGGSHGNAVSLVSSPDSGKTWSEPRALAPYRPWSGVIEHPANAGRSAVFGTDIARGTVDPESGALHVVFTDGVDSAGASRSRLWLTSSFDIGVTWSAPTAVGPSDAAHTVLPDVVTIGGGKVAISFLSLATPGPTDGKGWPATLRVHELRPAATGPATLLRAAVADSFVVWPLRENGGYFLGDYFSLVRAPHGRVIPFYVKTTCEGTLVRCRTAPGAPDARVRAEVFAAVPR